LSPDGRQRFFSRRAPGKFMNHLSPYAASFTFALRRHRRRRMINRTAILHLHICEYHSSVFQLRTYNFSCTLRRHINEIFSISIHGRLHLEKKKANYVTVLSHLGHEIELSDTSLPPL
jgi:hypothetical protein